MRSGFRKEVRVLGIDDCPFDKFKDKYTSIVGVLFRGGSFADGFTHSRILIDGYDSTEKIIDMVKNSHFKHQLRCIFLDGIAMGGFNVIDIKKLYASLHIPVIVVIRRRPDIENIRNVLLRLGMEAKVRLLDQAPPVHELGRIYVQFLGLSLDQVKELVNLTAVHSFLPEPLRLAHLIAHALVYGESNGNA